MTEFDEILEECLDNLDQGASSVDECLSRYPKHASELRPILLTSAYLDRTREMHPSAAFKSRVRAKLTRDMQVYPRKSRAFIFPFVPFTRLAASFAVMTLAFLITITAFAQRALPGDAFYSWKLASEEAWRAVSPDPVGTDLAIAERRVDELLAVQDDPVRYALALEAYVDVVLRLRSAMDAVNGERILLMLESQAKVLNEAGLPLPQPELNLPSQTENTLPAPTELPSGIPPTAPAIPVSTAVPLPTSALPTAGAIVTDAVLPTDSNDLPLFVPTVNIPPIQTTPLLP